MKCIHQSSPAEVSPISKSRFQNYDDDWNEIYEAVDQNTVGLRCSLIPPCRLVREYPVPCRMDSEDAQDY